MCEKVKIHFLRLWKYSLLIFRCYCMNILCQIILVNIPADASSSLYPSSSLYKLIMNSKVICIDKLSLHTQHILSLTGTGYHHCTITFYSQAELLTKAMTELFLTIKQSLWYAGKIYVRKNDNLWRFLLCYVIGYLI